MKITTALLWLTLIGGVAKIGVSGETSSLAYPTTASAVVQDYCMDDANGAGLSSRTIEKAFRFTTWKDGPGWDTAVLISKYCLSTVNQKKKAATVEVVYTVIGNLTPNELEEKRHDEKVIFDLVRKNGQWKIDRPQIPPHISVQTAVKHLEDLAQDDPERSQQIQKTIDTIKAIR